MVEKICFKCKQKKDISQFYYHSMMKDKHLNKCIDCSKSDALNNRNNKILYYRDYDVKRFATDVSRRQTHKQSSLKYSRDHPERKKARNLARRAFLLGEIKKCACESCGKAEVEMHHPDYSKPLEIMWLCKICHEEWHKKYGDAK